MSVTAETLPPCRRPRGDGLLSRAEQLSLGLRLTLSLIAGGCLILSTALQFLAPSQRDVAELVAGVAALLVAVPALSAAWQSLRYPDLHGITDQLIALALIAAWAAGDLMTAALLPLVMTLGHILEERSLLGSQEAIRALSKLTQVKTRRLLPNGEVEEVNTQALRAGDLIDLRAGDLIPADGLVHSGASSVDTASITGELVPVEVQVGNEVFSGSINGDGHLVVKLTRVGEDSTLGRVIALLQDAESAKPPGHPAPGALCRTLHGAGAADRGRHLVCDQQHGGGAGGAGRLLPLRPGAGGARDLDRRDRGGEPPRHSGQGRGLPGEPRDRRCGGVRQDRHRHGRPTAAGGGARRARRRSARPQGAGRQSRRAPAIIRSAGRWPRWPSPAGRRCTRSRNRAASAWSACRARRPWRSAAPSCSRSSGVAISAPPDHDGPMVGVARGGKFLGWMLLADEPRAGGARGHRRSARARAAPPGAADRRPRDRRAPHRAISWGCRTSAPKRCRPRR